MRKIPYGHPKEERRGYAFGAEDRGMWIVANDDFWTLLRDREESVIAIVAIVGSMGTGLVIAGLAITCATIRQITVGRAREQTKRELAAYVAEGTIEADKAIAMLNAAEDPKNRRDFA
jgi:hypothetical protein